MSTTCYIPTLKLEKLIADHVRQYVGYKLRCPVAFCACLYSIGQIRHIIRSILTGSSPFILAKLVLNILVCLLVTRIFSINLGSISLIGIIIGILVLFVSEIFKYGALLQEEHDSTL